MAQAWIWKAGLFNEAVMAKMLYYLGLILHCSQVHFMWNYRCVGSIPTKPVNITTAAYMGVYSRHRDTFSKLTEFLWGLCIESQLWV